MSDPVDEVLARFSNAVAQISPDAVPLTVRHEPARRNPALVVAAGFVGVVVVSAISLALGLIGPGNQDVMTGEPIDLVERWEWMTENAERILGVVAIEDLGPQPVSELSDYGEPLMLLPVAALPERVGPPVSRPDSEWDIAYVGTIPETSTRVYAFLLTSGPDAPGFCIATENADGGGSVCLYEPFATGGELVVSHSSDGEIVLLVPQETAVVVAGLEDGRRVAQHPVGGISVIQLQDAQGGDTVTLTALDGSDAVIGRQTLELRRVGDGQ